jgi:hypothetical protein
MKKYLSMIVCAILSLVTCTSCIDSNLEDLDTYDGAEITSLNGVYYRYKTTTVMNVSGDYQVKQETLSVSKRAVDSDAATLTIACSPSSSFPSDQLANINSTNLIVAVNISTAATIKPLDGAPALGVPGDWSKPNKYRVTAANGTTKDWTISVTFTK